MAFTIPKRLATGKVLTRSEELLAPYARDLDEDQLRELTDYACKAKDLYETGQADTWEEASVKAAVSF